MAAKISSVIADRNFQQHREYLAYPSRGLVKIAKTGGAAGECWETNAAGKRCARVAISQVGMAQHESRGNSARPNPDGVTT